MEFLHSEVLRGDADKKGCYYKEVVPTNATRLCEKQDQTRDKAETVYRSYSGAHTKWCYNRRFFVSSAERYGWAVDGTKVGDVVVVFYGCPYPFLLRESSDESYRIIGDCYIHGFMDGEAMEGAFEEKEFVIS